jgi:Transcriptional regulatory protein, C terminal
VNVVLVRWPNEADRRERLVAQSRPRLLVIEGQADPPVPVDCLEDWIRVPASEVDVSIRLRGLSGRVGRHTPGCPSLDGDGVLRFGSAWAALPPVESRLVAALVERFGGVVGRDALATAGWPEGAPGRNALDVHVLRLRRRIVPLGLVIRTVRSRGYVLEGAAAE